VLIKGGVWKNSEDEILKAGIMKYGKNQWGRVATLLPRKSAKQCKRRWYEWLDPMIKKTEWTREEDEKLLHLAKLMPTQWRTIAPMIGRTAGQCIERYGKLLDMATGGDEQDDEARKLRPGEVDTNPEDKPARPDPVDMDEDEKEMLSEAKARLANTRGKKAKRKARERLLENAKRMAKLQRYRELKSAGVSSSGLNVMRTSKERRGIDYANEIPFERNVPTGFYDTSNEIEDGLALAKSSESRKKLLQVANEDSDKRAKAEKEAMKRDRERFERLAKDNLEQAMKEIDERNSAVSAQVNRKRGKLSLPAPQVGDAELEDIAKIVRKSKTTTHGSSSSSTHILVGDYSAQTPSLSQASSTIRTPVVPDVVLEEARNQKLRTKTQTPLVGGENVVTTQGTGFDGHAPSVRSVVTPSVVTPAGGSVSTNRTTSSSASLALRDHFKINAEETELTEAVISKQEAKAKKARAIESLNKGFLGLPAPKYSYEVDILSKTTATSDDETEERTVDKADEIAFENLKRKAREQLVLENRSSVRKRKLPQPIEIGEIVADNDLVREELVKIVQNDIDEVEETRKVAKQNIDDMVKEQATAMFGDAFQNIDSNKFGEIWKRMRDSYVVCPSGEKTIVPKDDESRKKKRKLDPVTVFLGPFRAIRNPSDSDIKTAERMSYVNIEARLNLVSSSLKKARRKTEKLVFGLQTRAQKALDQLKTAQHDLAIASRNTDTFKYMREQEFSSIPSRINDWKTRSDRAAKLEQQYQALFYEKFTR